MKLNPLHQNLVLGYFFFFIKEIIRAIEKYETFPFLDKLIRR